MLERVVFRIFHSYSRRDEIVDNRRVFTRQPENSEHAHLRIPALQNTPKFHDKAPRERDKKSENGGRKGKISEILGGPAEGRAQGWSGVGWSRGGSKPTTTTPTTNNHTNTNTKHQHHQQQQHQNELAQIGLAKVGHNRLCLILRIDPSQPFEVRDAAALPLSLGGSGVAECVSNKGASELELGQLGKLLRRDSPMTSKCR